MLIAAGTVCDAPDVSGLFVSSCWATHAAPCSRVCLPAVARLAAAAAAGRQRPRLPLHALSAQFSSLTQWPPWQPQPCACLLGPACGLALPRPHAASPRNPVLPAASRVSGRGPPPRSSQVRHERRWDCRCEPQAPLASVPNEPQGGARSLEAGCLANGAAPPPPPPHPVVAASRLPPGQRARARAPRSSPAPRPWWSS